MKTTYIIFFTVMLCFALTGCVELDRKTTSATEEHLATIDQKLEEYNQLITDLNTNAQNLTKRVDMLMEKNADLSTNYLNLHDTVNKLIANVEAKDKSQDSELSNVQNDIKEIEAKLDEIEKTKAALQNQIIALQNQRSRLISSKVGPEGEAMKKQAEKMLNEGHEMAKEAKTELEVPDEEAEESEKAEDELSGLSEKQKKDKMHELLYNALKLYREGHYQEALAMWEKVLEIDPNNLESKFNIEITKEKIRSMSEK